MACLECDLSIYLSRIVVLKAFCLGHKSSVQQRGAERPNCSMDDTCLLITQLL